MSTNKLLIKKTLLSALYSSYKGLYPHSLLYKTKVSPSVLLDVLSELVQEKLVEEKNDKLFITKEGKEFVVSSIHGNVGEKPWRKIPSEFQIDQKNTQKFYVPSISRLDSNFFSKFIEDNRG